VRRREKVTSLPGLQLSGSITEEAQTRGMRNKDRSTSVVVTLKSSLKHYFDFFCLFPDGVPPYPGGRESSCTPSWAVFGFLESISLQ
jgi:hypothetical protein